MIKKKTHFIKSILTESAVGQANDKHVAANNHQQQFNIKKHFRVQTIQSKLLTHN